MPQLQAYNMLASPHAFGNVVTIEGVTCNSEDIDYGDYLIDGGSIQVSEKSGFGMKLLR